MRKCSNSTSNNIDCAVSGTTQSDHIPLLFAMPDDLQEMEKLFFNKCLVITRKLIGHQGW